MSTKVLAVLGVGAVVLCLTATSWATVIVTYGTSTKIDITQTTYATDGAKSGFANVDASGTVVDFYASTTATFGGVAAVGFPGAGYTGNPGLNQTGQDTAAMRLIGNMTQIVHNANSQQFTISGLNVNRIYKVQILGYDNKSTQYSIIAGGVTTNLGAAVDSSGFNTWTTTGGYNHCGTANLVTATVRGASSFDVKAYSGAEYGPGLNGVIVSDIGAAPEPATMVLLALGGIGALLRRRK